MCVGDVVKVIDGEYFLVDLLLFFFIGLEVICYIDIKNFDGEINLKVFFYFIWEFFIFLFFKVLFLRLVNSVFEFMFGELLLWWFYVIILVWDNEVCGFWWVWYVGVLCFGVYMYNWLEKWWECIRRVLGYCEMWWFKCIFL